MRVSTGKRIGRGWVWWIVGMVGLGAIVLGLVLPAINVSRNHVHRAYCANNLRQLGLGLHMYSGDHRERFPDDLVALEKYVKQTDLLVCPSSDPRLITKAVDFQHISRTNSSYYYIAGLLESSVDNDHVHMFDLPAEHRGAYGANVLYAGGYVGFVPLESPDNWTPFWEVLATNGITRQMVLDATNKVIRL